jgi:lysozyme family protein
MKYTAKLAAYYKGLWNGLQVTPARRKEAETFAKVILANKKRYQRIEATTGVPWHFVALTHYRESTLNFNKNLCNGQPLNMRTTIVPKGRGPYRSFEESAHDALVNIKKYSARLDWSLGPYMHRIEGYNGYGYHNPRQNGVSYPAIPSPYLVGGSNKQKRGKYTRDHWYDPDHWDTQLGVITLLKVLSEMDSSIKFGNEPVSAPTPLPPDVEPEDDDFVPPPPSPKAEDDSKPIVKSKTFWASVVGFFVMIWEAFSSAATNPYFWVFLIVAAIFAYIVWERNGKPDIRGWFR